MNNKKNKTIEVPCLRLGEGNYSLGFREVADNPDGKPMIAIGVFKPDRKLVVGKPTGIKRVSICISGQPEQIEKLKEMAAQEEKTVSAFILEKTGANKMEKDFFELYSKIDLLALEVGHNSVADWNVIIYDRRGKEAGNWGDPVIHVQGSHRELVFAKAYAELAEYFSEHFGWY